MTLAAPSRLDCPACGAERVRMFHEVPDVPVNNVLLLATRREAIEFPRGDLRLAFCEECGFIYNTAFDPALPEYSSRYEETQGFSPTFRRWHETLAHRLIERYELRGKKIVEVGCGKGEFLTMMCEMGNNRGVGFDPVYLPERNASTARDRIEFILDNYSERYAGLGGDFFCCKMTLEHINEPRAFVAMVRRTLGDARATVVFFQMPDVLRVLNDVAFWDVYYEHCSYFSIGSLARLFHHTGFEVLDLSRAYNDQYLTVEARPANGSRGVALPQENDLEQLAQLVTRFAERMPGQLALWRERLRTYRDERRRAVIWGAGSKGVAFLTTLNVPGAVEYAVDINPNKHGHFMPTTGQEIVGPEFLREYRPDVVIVMNSIYCGEIGAELRQMGLEPEVVST